MDREKYQPTAVHLSLETTVGIFCEASLTVFIPFQVAVVSHQQGDITVCYHSQYSKITLCFTLKRLPSFLFSLPIIKTSLSYTFRQRHKRDFLSFLDFVCQMVFSSNKSLLQSMPLKASLYKLSHCLNRHFWYWRPNANVIKIDWIHHHFAYFVIFSICPRMTI